MKKVASPTGSKGFTLLEVLLAVAIFALGAAVIFPVFLKSTNMLSITAHRFQAELFMDNWLNETQQALKLQRASLNGSRGQYQKDNQIYHYSTDVQPMFEGSPLYRVQISVEWSDFRKNKIGKTLYALK